MSGGSPAVLTALALVGALFVGVVEAPGQVGRPRDAEASLTPIEVPNISQAVTARLEAPYLTVEEGKDLRIFHGVFRESDLDTPARAARAALLVGRYDDPALLAPEADASDRAEARLALGLPEDAMALVEGHDGLRAAAVRAESLFLLGRYDEARAECERAVGRLAEQPTADDIVAATRVLALRARLVDPGSSEAAAREYNAMMGLLAQARTRFDRLHWPSMLMEARLLYEKDNRPQAAEALQRVLSLNPSSAEAWRLLGQLNVDSFNMPVVERIALRLDALARDPGELEDASPGDLSTGSYLAAMIRARGAMRVSDPGRAAEAIRPHLERHPTGRHLLALDAAVEALRFDFDALDAAIARYHRLSPRSTLAQLEAGRALAEARQYEPAIRMLAGATHRLPTDPEAFVALGLVKMQAAQDAEAREALATAHRLDPFHVRADNSLRLVERLLALDTQRSEHFIVRHAGGMDAHLASEMLPVLEEIHAVVAGSQPGGIDFTPRQPTLVDLLPDHASFAVRIAGMPQIHTIAAATGPLIAMETPRDGAGHSGAYDWERVVRHEYVHTVTLARTNNRIPHWFTEAAAVYLELAPRDWSTVNLIASAYAAGGLFDLDEINIAFVRPRRPQDRSLAYAQGHWMYEFILDRWGPRAPLDLMDLYARGEREESAFQSVLGLSRDEFVKEFLPWAREQLVSWGMAHPEDRPSVKALLMESVLEDRTRRFDVASSLEGAAREGVMVLAGLGGISPEPGIRAADPFELILPRLTSTLVNDLLQNHPDHPDLLEQAVRDALLERAGEADYTVAPLLERYARARPVDPTPHRLLAQLYINRADDPGAPADARQRAIPHLEFLDAREQRLPTYAAELARRYAAVRDLDSAHTKAERATRIAPYDPSMRELAATIALQRSDLRTAARHLIALTLLEPDRPRHRQRLEAVEARLAASASGQ